MGATRPNGYRPGCPKDVRVVRVCPKARIFRPYGAQGQALAREYMTEILLNAGNEPPIENISPPRTPAPDTRPGHPPGPAPD